MIIPKAHNGDIYSCEWNHINKALFASSGNDMCGRITDFNKPTNFTFLKGHIGPVNQITWHPTQYS